MVKSTTILLGVSILACGVALGSLCVGYKAAGQAEAYMQECLALRVQLNQAMKHIEKLSRTSANTVKREELTLIVKPSGKGVSQQNRNPFNLKKPSKGGDWKGTIGYDRQGHAIFANEAYGIRAGIKNLIAQETMYGICTIDALVNKYSASNREAYKKFLSEKLHLGIKEKFSIRKRAPELAIAMVRFERGEELPIQYKEMMRLASL